MRAWVGYNYAKGYRSPEDVGLHFFLDDYQFERLWAQPDSYLDRLRSFACVCTPDFSIYTDFPKAVQLYNHFRKHWLGAYWQQCGITVIPTISWSDEGSFEWCFDGEPVGSCVAVSSVGTQATVDSQRLFLAGYQEMLHRLKPTQIYFYGDVPDVCQGNIVPIQAFYHKIVRRRRR